MLRTFQELPLTSERVGSSGQDSVRFSEPYVSSTFPLLPLQISLSVVAHEMILHNESGYKLMGMLPNFLTTRPQTAEQDFSGTVISVPSTSASRFQPGDKVWGIAGGTSVNGQGALSEYIAIDEDRLALVLSGVSMDEAAGLATIGITAVQALEVIGPEPGWHVFVVGGEL